MFQRLHALCSKYVAVCEKPAKFVSTLYVFHVAATDVHMQSSTVACRTDAAAKPYGLLRMRKCVVYPVHA